MTRRCLLRRGVLAGLGLAAPPMLNLGRVRLFADEPRVISTRAIDLVLGSTVIDMLGLLTLNWSTLFRWLRNRDAFGDLEYRRLASSGIKIFHPAVDTGLARPVEASRAWMDGWQLLLGSHVCRLARVETAADLVRIPATGRIGVIVGFQNSSHFRDRGDVVRCFKLGQRVSQLTYSERNRLGSGCYERRDGGLTSFGAAIVDAMDDVGMAIDISHCGERTSLDAIEASRRPVLVTHANCRALNPSQPRCKSDKVIRAMASSGGVMGITTVRAFVGGDASLDTLLDHFAHVARVAGVEHVGLGSDVDIDASDPRSGKPLSFYAIRGLDTRLRVFQIAEGLLARGFSSRDVELVLGGNFIRALDTIWPRRSGPAPDELPWTRDPFCPPAARPSPPAVRSR